MKRTCVAVCAAALATASLGAQQTEDLYSIPAKAKYQTGTLAGKRPLTRAERTNYAATSSYADVLVFIDSLKVLGARIHTGSIGKSSEGRDLPYVIASRPLVTTPAEARRLGRPVAYIQANIHSGEVEGKEAMLAMLRDLLFDAKRNVLDSIVLIVQPIYNADGNNKLGQQSRLGSQNGPVLTGTRPQARGINLNRDYVGADAPETRASLAMLNKWNPDLFMDLHTTNGSMHGYALTYAPTLSPTALTTRPYLTQTMLPTIRQRVRDRQGFEMNDYGDFRLTRPAGASAGRGGGRGGPPFEMMLADSTPSGVVFATYEALPRYGTNYYGLRGRLSILSEAFSHDPFPRRIASTYAFVGEILSFLAERRREIIALGRAADAQVAAWAAKPASSPQLALQSRMDTTRVEDVRVEVIVPLRDSTKRELGMPAGRQRTGIIKTVRMPMMVSFAPTLTRSLPFAYAFDDRAAERLLPILNIHGVKVERLTASANAHTQRFAVDSVIDRGRNETPRNLKMTRGRWAEPVRTGLPAGTYVVRAGQPLGLLAFYLLEPESDDGLTSFLDGLVAVGAEFPVARITAPVSLHTRPVR